MRRTFLTHSLWLLAFLLTFPLAAETPKELQFKSRYDQFTLQRTGGHYRMNGQRVLMGSFEQFLDLFDSKIEGDCSGLKSKPDLTVKAALSTGNVERRFYANEGLVSDGKNCATVNGDGIYLIPLHRSWFEDKKTESIAVQSPLILKREQEVLAHFEKHRGEWRSGGGIRFPNWDFFTQFQSHLKDFTIDQRAHPAFAKDKPSFVLQSGKKTYTFYKLNATLWAVSIPGTAWLLGSSQWTQWLDMEKSQWTDRASAQLEFVADKGKQLEERASTLASLDGQWSPSIRELLSGLLLDKDEASRLKNEAARQMRSKPTMENMGTLVEALSRSDDPEVLHTITNALKVRRPKGPVIQIDASIEARQAAIHDWKKWWKDQKN